MTASPLNYDAWFDYLRLCETEADHTRTRDVYERAIANVPPANEKRLWRRYIYLWINYAVFEELTAEDATRTRAIYKACLDLIPHKIVRPVSLHPFFPRSLAHVVVFWVQFTFAKIWLLFAQFEIRQMDMVAARRILGQAIGLCPKEKLFKVFFFSSFKYFSDHRLDSHSYNFRGTLRLSYRRVSSNAAALSTPSFSSSIQPTAKRGSVSRNLKPFLATLIVPAPYLSWQLHSLSLICPRY